nr:MAG TPA: hypothetical protein [Caudoviricetes sp.]
MKLQILIPQHKETDEIVKPLLDSIAIQQNVDFDQIGVIICNDGTDVHLSDELINSYPFAVEYHLEPHRGVSGTRNACLDYATADYVMFCDADDMFFNACGLYIIFREIANGGFDSLVSAFVEETRNPVDKSPLYVNHDMDSTFVHGKIHRRKYLIDNGIRWNDELTIHEDSYFNCLCQKLSQNVKYCPTAFYLWKWRDESVCRHDPKYILKTYNNMLDSNTALVKQFIERKRLPDAQFYAVSMIYDAYFTMNKNEWIAQENQQYRIDVEKRFKRYYAKFETLFESCPNDIRSQIIMGIKNRMFGEGLLMETQTFDQWIEHIKKMEE